MDGVPVHGERGAAEDPHRHDDHHLQEDLRRPRQAVEVSSQTYTVSTVQICQESQRIGCVIAHCNLKCGITQPILKLFFTYLYTGSSERKVAKLRESSACLRLAVA